MDGKGAWRDNVFVERLWRSVKYEEVYLVRARFFNGKINRCVRPELVWGLLWPMGVMDLPARHIDG